MGKPQTHKKKQNKVIKKLTLIKIKTLFVLILVTMLKRAEIILKQVNINKHILNLHNNKHFINMVLHLIIIQHNKMQHHNYLLLILILYFHLLIILLLHQLLILLLVEVVVVLFILLIFNTNLIIHLK